MSQDFPVIPMNPSIVARLFFTVVTAFTFWAIFGLDPPNPEQGDVPHTMASKAFSLICIAAAAAFFLTTKAFNQRMEFHPDKFVFIAFRQHQVIPAADIQNVYYKGYDIVGALENSALRAAGLADRVNDSPHLVFIMKSGDRIPVRINPGVEKQAIAYLQDMLRRNP